MTRVPVPLAVAMGLLVFLSVVAIVLIPILDKALCRAIARGPANDNAAAAEPEISREVGHG